MKIETILIAYCCLFLVGRFVSGISSTQSWEIALTVAIGVALAMQPVRRAASKAKLTTASFLTFPLLLALAVVSLRLFVLLPSVVFVTYGLRGLVNGKIVLAGRFGPEREHAGAAAYLHSAFCILCGAAMISVDVIFPGFWER